METTASLPLALYRARVEQVKAFFAYISRFVGFLAGAAIRLSGVQLFPCVLAIAAGRIARRPTAGGGGLAAEGCVSAISARGDADDCRETAVRVGAIQLSLSLALSRRVDPPSTPAQTTHGTPSTSTCIMTARGTSAPRRASSGVS